MAFPPPGVAGCYAQAAGGTGGPPCQENRPPQARELVAPLKRATPRVTCLSGF